MFVEGIIYRHILYDTTGWRPSIKINCFVGVSLEKVVVKYKIEISSLNKKTIIFWELAYLASQSLHNIRENAV